MNALESLQQWYESQCNGDWEHTNGISIESLDNPGWSLAIDLEGTPLEETPFTAVSRGLAKGGEAAGDDWIACKVERKRFIGHGDPGKLEEMIRVFLAWAEAQP